MNHAIFTTFDDQYFKYAIPFLNSIQKNYPGHPVILIYYSGSNPEIISKVEKYKNIKLVSHQQDLEKLQGLSMGVVNSPNVFIRYILWSDVFAEYDNILHLDIDLVVLKPLDDLIKKSDFFCVSDHSNTPDYRILDPQKSTENKLLELLEKDQIKLPSGQDDMMNAGVFLIPKKYRTSEQEQKLWDITRRYNNYMMFADQSAISLWCHVNKIQISEEYQYNFQASFFYSDSFFYEHTDQLLNAIDDIHIYHFSWWKPDHDFYSRFMLIAGKFREIEDQRKLLS